MTFDETHDDEAIMAEFFDLWVADRDAGEIRPLPDYQLRFPGHEEVIARLYRSADLAETLPQTTGGDAVSEDRLGPYAINREIGRGGQGVVYRATDTRIGRTVALKVLRNVGVGAHETLLRFKREAQAASRTDHPGVCAVYDAEMAGGIAYIAMRYVKGDTLAARISMTRDEHSETAPESTIQLDFDDDGVIDDTDEEPAITPLPRSELSRWVLIVERAARALHAVHEAGVVHRDIKPSNIMVTSEDDPILMDFGLATDDDSELSLTGSGVLLGTPFYMSPEQLSRGSVKTDHRTDIWALGATLFECLTFYRPFEGATREALYNAIMTRDPRDPRRLNPSISKDLRTVLLCCLEKDRDRRYQSAKALAEDLRRIRHGQPVVARPVGSFGRIVRWAKRNPAVATLAAGLFLSLSVGLVASLGLLFERDEALGEKSAALASRAKALVKAREDEAAARMGEARARIGAGLHELDDLARQSTALWPLSRAGIDEELEQWLRRFDRWAKQMRVALADAPPRDPEAEVLRDCMREALLAEDGLPRPREVRFSRDSSYGHVFDWKLSPYHRLREQVQFRRRLLETLRTRLSEDDSGAWEAFMVAWRDANGRYAGASGWEPAPVAGLRPLGQNSQGYYVFEVLSSCARLKGDRIVVNLGKGIRLVLLPGGRARIGNDLVAGADRERAEDEETLVTGIGEAEVKLSPFLIAENELSQGHFKRVAGYEPSRFGQANLSPWTADHPVESVSWLGAGAVLRVLGLEFPTEAQWEYAARAGTTTPWNAGISIREVIGRGAANVLDRSADEAGIANEVNREAELRYSDGHQAHVPSKTLPPNQFGLRAMHGNVREWCLDGMVPYSSAKSPIRPPNGRTWALGRRVVRGGSYALPPLLSRSAVRHAERVEASALDLGVRPVLNLVPHAPRK